MFKKLLRNLPVVGGAAAGTPVYGFRRARADLGLTDTGSAAAGVRAVVRVADECPDGHRRVYCPRLGLGAAALTFRLADIRDGGAGAAGEISAAACRLATADAWCAERPAPVCVVVGARSRGERALLIAAAVACCSAWSRCSTKVTRTPNEEGLLGTSSSPYPISVVTLGIAVRSLQQSAFHAGALQTSVPTMPVLEPLGGGYRWALSCSARALAATGVATVALPIAVVAMAAVTIALGRDEGAFEDQLEAELVQRWGHLPPEG